jgi:hypothetical protein
MDDRAEARRERSDNLWTVATIVAASFLAFAVVASLWSLATGEFGTFAGTAVSVIFWYWIAAGSARRTRWARS